jgi:uncharacterized membrane protein
MRNRRDGRVLSVLLIGLAVAAGVLGALLEFTLKPQDSIDPHHSGFGTAAGIASAFCVAALWRLKELGRGRERWWAAACWFGLAVVALVALVAVAFASRLGG